MHYTKLSAAALTVLSVGVNAKTIKIQVGADGLKFTPSSVTADKGDILEYHFTSQDHSVAQGDFTKACNPVSSGGFFSGVMAASGSDPQVFQVEVTTTDPIFFYCTVPGHCNAGMVGVVNPTSSQSFEDYADNAVTSTSESAPKAVFGGKLVKQSAASSAAASAGSSSTGSASAPASSTGSKTASAADSSKTSSAADSSKTTTATGSEKSSATATGASKTASAAGTSTAASASATSTKNAALPLGASFGSLIVAAAGAAAFLS